MLLPGMNKLKISMLEGLAAGVKEYVDYTFGDDNSINCMWIGAHDFFMEEVEDYKKLYISFTNKKHIKNEFFNATLRHYCLCKETINERAEVICDEVIKDWRKELDFKNAKWKKVDKDLYDREIKV